MGALLVDRSDEVPGVALLVLALYLASFITAFFGIALAGSARPCRQVFAVVLYRYALDGSVVGGFSADELEGSVRSRRRRW